MDPTVILIVEDDATISDLVAYNLRREGFEVRQEWTGRSGLETAHAADVDLVLLDLMLPGLDGMAVSREIKCRKPHLPIIMLTARSERETMLEGFESGADDYVTKPFDMDVLLARINARLRGQRPVVSRESTPTLAGLELDRDTHMLRIESSGRAKELQLKPKEFDLLQLLASQPGHLFTREEIVERVWHHKHIPGSRTLDVHVRRVREKLAKLEAPVILETVRGVGYRVTDAKEVGAANA